MAEGPGFRYFILSTLPLTGRPQGLVKGINIRIDNGVKMFLSSIQSDVLVVLSPCLGDASPHLLCYIETPFTHPQLGSPHFFSQLFLCAHTECERGAVDSL